MTVNKSKVSHNSLLRLPLSQTLHKLKVSKQNVTGLSHYQRRTGCPLSHGKQLHS